MSPEILRLKTFAGLSYAAIAVIGVGMSIGMVKSNDGQSVLAFFTGGIGGAVTVISLWANPPGSNKQKDQVNLSSGGLQVNVTDTSTEPVTESASESQDFRESESRMLR